MGLKKALNFNIFQTKEKYVFIFFHQNKLRIGLFWIKLLLISLFDWTYILPLWIFLLRDEILPTSQIWNQKKKLVKKGFCSPLRLYLSSPSHTFPSLLLLSPTSPLLPYFPPLLPLVPPPHLPARPLHPTAPSSIPLTFHTSPIHFHHNFFPSLYFPALPLP